MDESELHKLIDSARPEDLHLPEMQPLAERLEKDADIRARFAESQRFDAGIKDALNDVVVPQGLAERILANLDSSPKDHEPADESTPAAEETDATSVAVRPASVDRTRWQALAVTLSGLAAAITLFALTFPRDHGTLTGSELAGRVHAWRLAVSDQSWRTSEPPVQKFPLTRNVTLPWRRWQRVSTGSSQENVVCYDLSTRDRVLLFVLQTDRSVELPPSPRGVRPWNTQGICIGLWQEEGTVFALAVEGSAQRYQELIRPTPHIARARQRGGDVAG